MRKTLSISFLALACCLRFGLAQPSDETNARVQELDEFHKPIYKLWHDAWPSKDISSLRSLLPEVEEAYKKLAAAKLPGILRDKEQRWDEKLGLLGEAVKDYRASVATNDTAGILKATENVHLYYEQMVRVVRPVLKEIEAFHQALYPLHHYYMPERAIHKIKASADSMLQRIETLNAAQLPPRLEKKVKEFGKARENLSDAVKAFAKAVREEKDEESIAKLERILHARYQALEKVLE